MGSGEEIVEKHFTGKSSCVYDAYTLWFTLLSSSPLGFIKYCRPFWRMIPILRRFISRIDHHHHEGGADVVKIQTLLLGSVRLRAFRSHVRLSGLPATECFIGTLSESLFIGFAHALDFGGYLLKIIAHYEPWFSRLEHHWHFVFHIWVALFFILHI